MEIVLILYVAIGPIVALAQMDINNHLYGDGFTKDYLRLAALWPLVLLGVYR